MQPPEDEVVSVFTIMPLIKTRAIYTFKLIARKHSIPGVQKKPISKEVSSFR